ncbi:Calcium-transporting ATPase 1 [Maioricimonas rarisocia]|uniref:Calcium-transporting ATPase 1 n=1 Tax=Maioricimonas rarisocia TaxID=2528026 RepID=A0A517ZBZ3_9PLAN|nr:cation-translocating P-type ATPase [Maioricimonas rarisocia]QDU39987.1 Calcium-transporting ATPase 1 [Maioricimonas rarisocia]
MWYSRDIEDVLSDLGSDPEQGLSEAEAAERLEKYGPNELIETGGRGPWEILWEQISAPLVVLLVVAAIVSAFLGEYTDAIAITAIIVLNAILGFVQEYRAEKAMAALKQMAAPEVKVRRDGVLKQISSRLLVPGDLVVIETGNRVPADARLIEAVNLKVEEAALTGESQPVDKQPAALADEEVALADRTNQVFMGTVVRYGRGRAVVTETGMQTELGKIATLLQTVEQEPTPLQRKLARLSKRLAIATLGIVVIVFVAGVLRDEPARLMFMTALSMAVAVVPEGLPAVATVALALGTRRMLKRNALIRKLPAVETLGAVTVICSDKTGTLTENRMAVDTVVTATDDWRAAERGASTTTSVVESHPDVALLLLVGELCNDAEVEHVDGETVAVGDPTEGALVLAAERVGLWAEDLQERWPRLAEVPFDSDRKRMTTVHRVNGEAPAPGVAGVLPLLKSAGSTGVLGCTKGASSAILDVADREWRAGQIVPLDNRRRDEIAETNDRLAGNGQRVLAVAMKMLDESIASRNDVEETAERDLVFLGLVGLMDRPRPEVRDAVARCRAAGIRPVMITGDHPLTAAYIGSELGFETTRDAVTGLTLEKTSDEELEALLNETSIYARVSPEHKLRIVTALQRSGHVVAMTGDGVNDAPALKRADIGVAMGITGTDVSKDASEMVLLDDNFASIVGAVEEGRLVYDNIIKFLRYTLTSNSGEIWVMLLGPAMGMPLPLLPLQILWVNLVTDGLPGLALAIEQPELDTMERPPRRIQEPVLSWSMIFDIVWIGLLMGGVSIAVGYRWWLLEPTETAHATWGTMVFTVLTLSQMGNAMAIRSDRESLFRLGVFSNMALVGAVALTFVLQLAVIYVPAMQEVFSTVSLSARELGVCLVLSTIVFWGVEAQKWVKRRLKRRREESDHPPAAGKNPVQ